MLGRRFGYGAVLLCPDCRAVLDGWRATPAARRAAAIPYGKRLEDGTYQQVIVGMDPAA